MCLGQASDSERGYECPMRIDSSSAESAGRSRWAGSASQKLEFCLNLHSPPRSLTFAWLAMSKNDMAYVFRLI
jgi:hypothetical protein